MKKTVHAILVLLLDTFLILSALTSVQPVQAQKKLKDKQSAKIEQRKKQSVYSQRYEAEKFYKKTGNIYIRKNGDAVPVASGISVSNQETYADGLKDVDLKDSIVLNHASNGQFVDFSNPVADASSYLNTIPEGQDTVTWKVQVPKSGYYRIRFRYNNPATESEIKVNGKSLNANRNIRDERNLRITINNERDPLSDEGWTGWMIFNISGYNDDNFTQADSQTDNNYEKVRNNVKWNNNYMNVYFKSGVNDLTLGIQAPPGQGVYDGPNLDYFDVTYIGKKYRAESQVPYAADDFKFQHPGIYYTIDDLKNMKINKDNLGTVYGKGYKEIKDSGLSDSDYQPNPQSLIDVGPYNNPNIGGTQFTKDGTAAHYNALRWYMDGSIANAKKAIEILNEWSYSLKEVGHGNDAKLRFALVGPDFLNAAEILKNVYNNDPKIPQEDKWQDKDIQAFEHFIRTMMIAKTGEYYPQANGNWDALIGGFNMAAGVYLNDTQLFNTAMKQFYLGDVRGKAYPSMGALSNYIYPSGESQESSRDQVHAQMGLTGLAYQCDIAWNQGIDLFSAYQNRLLSGTSYNAKYNMGGNVPSKTFISDRSRGTGASVFEIVANHYLNQVSVDTDVSAVEEAAEVLSRKQGTLNEAKVPAAYYGAMIFRDKKYSVSLDLKSNTKSLSKIGDRFIVSAQVKTDSELKDVRWHLSSKLKPYLRTSVNKQGAFVAELIKQPKSKIHASLSAGAVKNASVHQSIRLTIRNKRSH
ncbi:alginate lyase family protein [Sporolactobacillus shoreicorticis]|uniref:Alginate lyase family protein n=1 Tax=Sporolactobacillus shoreicorticis TaxID=1923877 RepID=A0ABW5S1D0_9BACL|nr:alginate lyase family protein [Sporolactobacillus shoreicorticis]MCO7124674.1 alginate lyase family protein [Sporolactobacillus shoreicorticis]